MQRKSDEFSDQFYDSSDPMFWLRIEDSGTDQVIVTDFFFGRRDDREMADHFEQALASLGRPRPSSLLFTDLGPPDELKTNRYLSRIRKVIEIVAERQGCVVRHAQIKSALGQVNLAAFLETDR